MSLHLFTFSDPIAVNYRRSLPGYFHVNLGTSYDVLLLRLLSSNLKITYKKTGKNIPVNWNVFSFPSHKVTRKSILPIKALFSPFTVQDYVRFSNKFYGRNLKFYQNLLQETVFYFYYSNQEQHLSAFVSLYRTLEYMSYSIPLMHSSHFGNYLGTFNALRSYFVDAKTSEIVFFQNFINRIYNGTPYLTLTTIFDFSNPDGVIARNCYDSFFRLMNPADWVTANPLTQLLEIENKNLLVLLKNTRNRYFHFGVGSQRNIHVTDLSDPDFFFGKINDGFFNWLSFIFGTVIKENLTNSLV
jgi:hypothetical protein